MKAARATFAARTAFIFSEGGSENHQRGKTPLESPHLIRNAFGNPEFFACETQGSYSMLLSQHERLSFFRGWFPALFGNSTFYSSAVQRKIRSP
jgi:hypothetical protein